MSSFSEELTKFNKKELCGKIYCPELCYNGRPKILEQNIFELNGPMNGRLYELRNYTDKEKFAKELDNEIKYELCSRAEYECFIDRLFSDGEESIKIDPYQQVKMNGDIFVDYCGENRKLFGGKKFKEANQRLKELYRARYKKNR